MEVTGGLGTKSSGGCALRRAERSTIARIYNFIDKIIGIATTTPKNTY